MIANTAKRKILVHTYKALLNLDFKQNSEIEVALTYHRKYFRFAPEYVIQVPTQQGTTNLPIKPINRPKYALYNIPYIPVRHNFLLSFKIFYCLCLWNAGPLFESFYLNDLIKDATFHNKNP